MLKQRIITGLVLAVILVGSVVYGSTEWVGILLTLVLFAATRELLALTLGWPLPPTLIGAAAFALLFWWSLALMTPPLIYWQALAGTVAWLLIAIALPFYRHSGRWPLLARVLMLGLGLDLLWFCIHGLVFVHYVYGGAVLLYLFSLVWVADIGAYFSGKRFGRRKLAPGISPGKTWEGVGGAMAAVLVWILLVFHLGEDWGMGLPLFIAIGLVTAAISIAGDLFESVLKREAGVKDSGRLLPGHGGVLDRIDSIIAASPVFVAATMTVTQA